MMKNAKKKIVHNQKKKCVLIFQNEYRLKSRVFKTKLGI